MDEMAFTELRSFLSQYKDIVLIEPEESYKLVTISNKGIIHLRNIVQGVEIKGDTAYRIKAGSFIYSRLAAHTGSFGLVPSELDGAIVTSEMPVFEINQNIILPDYLLYLLRQKKFLNSLFQLTKGMGRVRIKEKLLLSIKLPIHKDITDQKRVIESLDSKFENIEALDNTYSEQIGILSQIRKSLLQEAIEGKLTAKWRHEHPDLISGDNHASKLLENILKKKEQLNKTSKIKKNQQLYHIAEDDKLFDIPEGWIWCRFGEIAKQVIDCPHATPTYLDEGKICLRASNITPNGLLFNEQRFVSSEEFTSRINRLRPEKDDLVYIREGGRLGIAGLIDIDEDCCLGQRLMLLRFFEKFTAIFSVYYINSPIVYNKTLKIALGSASPHVNVRDVVSLAFPLPPIAEQIAIVEEVEKTLRIVNELEKEVSERKEQSEKLMQLVLREAFATKYEI